MLKVCWDCLAGDQQRHGEDTYGVHLNGAGSTQGTPWQSISGVNMFPMPALRARNEILLKGQMTDDHRLDIDLVTSNNTVRINISNRINESDNEDYFKISNFGNVIHESEASGLFTNGREYMFRFAVDGNGSSLDILVATDENEADQYVTSIAMDVRDLRHITANGNVQKLTFLFKND